MRIYLVGFMGCGKSTLGRRVAALLKLDFIDLDKYIEERSFRTIPQIFEEEGEQGFRKKERTALEEVSQFEKVIVATGGGAPCFYQNMDLMNSTGITIYIALDAQTLAERIVHSKTERPLITGKSREELMAFIHESLKKREPWYRQAKIILSDNNNLTPEALAATIKEVQ